MPLLIATLVEGLLHTDPEPLLANPSVHVRLVVAVPLLLAAERVLEQRCAQALDLFTEGGFAPDARAVDRIVASAEKLRDSWLPELILFIAAIGSSQLSLWTGAGLAGLAGRLSATDVWYASVSLPLFQFLLGRTLWRWVIWSRLLWQLSRLRLRLVPTHPDLAGGVGHLGFPVAGLTLAILAGSAVVAAVWAGQILAGRAELMTFAKPLVLLLVVGQIITVGPLVFFMGHLLRARIDGLRAYSGLALRYTLAFHTKWIEHGHDSREKLLGTSDIQSLADLTNGYRVVERMRLCPFAPRLMSLVLAATLLPMLPLFLTEMTVWEIAAKIARALVGGFPS